MTKETTDGRDFARDMRARRRTNTEGVCQNCGAQLIGEYCHQCGQAAKEPRRAVIGLVQDVFVDTLAIDGKLARTLGLLLWKPGALARRYLEGKRVSYSPPFRLYLFASVFFFLMLFWMFGSNVAMINGGDAGKVEISESGEVIVDGEPIPGAVLEADEVDEVRDAVESAKDSGKSFRDMTWEDTEYSGPDWLEPHAKTVFEAAQRAVDDPRLFVAETRENVPRFMLLAPVVYGATLLLLYIYRRKFYVYDHFVVSLYMHAALYAYALLALLLSRLPGVGWLAAAPIAWGWLQPFLVFRQVYGSNWFSAWVKWLISILIYLVAFILIITLGLSYSLYKS